MHSLEVLSMISNVGTLSTTPKARSQTFRPPCPVGTTAWQSAFASTLRLATILTLSGANSIFQVASDCCYHCWRSHHSQHRRLYRSLLLLRHVLLLQLLQLPQVLWQLLRLLRYPR